MLNSLLRNCRVFLLRIKLNGIYSLWTPIYCACHCDCDLERERDRVTVLLAIRTALAAELAYSTQLSTSI